MVVQFPKPSRRTEQTLEIVSTMEPRAEEARVTSLRAYRLRRLLAELPPLEQQVIALRYGFAPFQEHSIRATARKLNVSRDFIRRTEERALESLRRDWLELEAA